MHITAALRQARSAGMSTRFQPPMAVGRWFSCRMTLFERNHWKPALVLFVSVV
jgi:hypothetical protein